MFTVCTQYKFSHQWDQKFLLFLLTIETEKKECAAYAIDWPIVNAGSQRTSLTEYPSVSLHSLATQEPYTKLQATNFPNQQGLKQGKDLQIPEETELRTFMKKLPPQHVLYLQKSYLSCKCRTAPIMSAYPSYTRKHTHICKHPTQRWVQYQLQVALFG